MLFLIDLLIAGLATWRLTLMLYQDDAFTWLRDRAGVMYNQETNEVYATSLLGMILSCVWCLSWWIGLGWGLGLLLLPQWIFYLMAMPFILSAFTILIETWRVEK